MTARQIRVFGDPVLRTVSSPVVLRDHGTAGLVEDLRQEGIIPAWVDGPAMASLVLALANGIVLQAELDPDGPDRSAMAGQFAGLLLAAGSVPRKDAM